MGFFSGSNKEAEIKEAVISERIQKKYARYELNNIKDEYAKTIKGVMTSYDKAFEYNKDSEHIYDVNAYIDILAQQNWIMIKQMDETLKKLDEISKKLDK